MKRRAAVISAPLRVALVGGRAGQGARAPPGSPGAEGNGSSAAVRRLGAIDSEQDPLPCGWLSGSAESSSALPRSGRSVTAAHRRGISAHRQQGSSDRGSQTADHRRRGPETIPTARSGIGQARCPTTFERRGTGPAVAGRAIIRVVKSGAVVERVLRSHPGRQGSKTPVPPPGRSAAQRRLSPACAAAAGGPRRPIRPPRTRR